MRQQPEAMLCMRNGNLPVRIVILFDVPSVVPGGLAKTNDFFSLFSVVNRAARI